MHRVGHEPECAVTKLLFVTFWHFYFSFVIFDYGSTIVPRWSLQVSEEGDILYVFPRDYRSKLAAKSFRIKAEPFFEKAKVLKIVIYSASSC